jgi:4-amino-4-deoxy-L-arabinose transferase-like glycosyltransferase
MDGQEDPSAGPRLKILRLRAAAVFRAVSMPAFMAAAYFLLQLTQLNQYGVSWDEPLHRNWGKLFYLFWKTGDRVALELMPGHGVEYGPLFYTLSYLISEWLYGQGILSFVAASHLSTLVVASVSVGLTYALGRLFRGWKTGLGAVAFLIFFPSFLAHSHYNPKDIPLMAAVLATSVSFVMAMRSGRMRSFIVAAGWMGTAIAAKVSALIMAPVFLMTYVIWVAVDPHAQRLRGIRTQLVLVPSAIAACLGAMFVFWPSAWGDPLLIPGAVKFFLRPDFWPGRVLFFGTDYSGAELPWYYTPFEFMAVTPVLMLIALAAGSVLAVRKLRSRDTAAEASFLLLWSFFPLCITLIPGIVRYDGMRQFFFVLPPMCVLAAKGLRFFLGLLKRRARRASALPVFLLLVLISLGGEALITHPFQGSYRNEIIRTLYPEQMDRTFQIEYWGPSYLQGMEWLVSHAESNPVICVPTAGVLVEWYPWRPDFTFDCSRDTDYVMFFTRYTEAKDYADLPITPVFTISRMGADLLKIYKVR